MDFVVVQNGKALEPCSADQIRVLIRAKTVTKEAKVWRAGWKNWVPAQNVFPVEFGLTGNLFQKMEERGEVAHRPEENIYERVLKVVPTAQLEDLLRTTKAQTATDDSDKAPVKITSKNKEELVNQNIREAVRGGAVNEGDLETLLQEIEESGKQRIFLYKLRSASTAPELEYDAVLTRLFGSNASSITFPIFHALPAEPEVSSFRRYRSSDAALKAVGYKPKYSEGWLLRLDTRIQTEERLSEDNVDLPIRSVTYGPRLVDAVCVVRYWSYLGLLEVRLPQSNSRAALLLLRNSIATKFGEAIRFGAFDSFILSQSCTNILRTLLDDPKSEPGIKRIAGSHLREPDDATMKIEIPNLDAADVRTTKARRQSMKAYLNESSKVESLICAFVPPSGKEEVRVIISADDEHEISVRKQTSAIALDYVIHRLFENSKARD